MLISFYRFGKGRKSQEEISHRSRSEERSVTDTSKQRENRIVPNLKPVQTIDFIPISQSPSKPMQHSSKSRLAFLFFFRSKTFVYQKLSSGNI